MMTANRLLDGAVVYLTAADAWSENFSDGAVWHDQAGVDRAVSAGEQAANAQLVVGPYLFEVAVEDDGPTPTSVRERIRAAHQPSSLPDRGSWSGRIQD
jgi:hypothetical protein